MHALTLHNSLTRRKERFVPLDPLHVRMYVCGPTVYDLVHVGNARPAVVYDLLARLLRLLYPHVTYVRNITDVEDKINARAGELGVPIEELTARTTADYHADMAALGALPPDIEPRATAHIPEMIAIIERLIAGGYAYVAEGHVLFAVASYPPYGHLSGRSPEELLAGARIDVAPYKRDPGDFVLWKPSPAGSPGQALPELPGWDSPWGRGRPGWHIECSAMAWKHLGEKFRHPRRWDRPAVSASRERGGAELLRIPRQQLRALLGAQRHAAGRRREDVEEPRQLHDAARRAGAGARRGGAVACCCARIIVPRPITRRGGDRGAARAGSFLSRVGTFP